MKNNIQTKLIALTQKNYFRLSTLVLLFLIIISCAAKEKSNHELSQKASTHVADETETNSTLDGILFQSNDLGATWNDVSAGLPENGRIGMVYAQQDDVYVTSFESKVYHSKLASLNQWTKEHIGEYFNHEYITGFSEDKNSPIISISSHGYFKRIPLSTFWQANGENLKDELIYVVKETPDGTYYIATGSGIFKSQKDGTTWKKVYDKGWVKSLVLIDGNLVASSMQGILRSSDGDHWDCVVSDADALYKINVFNNTLVANREVIGWNTTHLDNAYLLSANNNGILYSTDGGKTWQTRNIKDKAPKIVYSVIQVGNALFASDKDGISTSADGGHTWTKIPFNASKYEMTKIKLIKAGNSILAFVMNDGC